MITTATKRLALAAVAAALTLSLGACANNSATPATAPAGTDTAAAGGVQLVNEGKLTVCTHLAYKPFQFTDDAGKIVGFDVDLMDLVAKDLGVTQEIVDIEFGQITSGAVFASKRCDAGAAAITITDERKQTMDFSAPYFDARQLIAVPSGSKVQRFEDLKTLRVAVQTATTGDEIISKLQGKTSPRIKRFESTPLALKELEAGGVDAVVADNGVIAHYVAHNSGAAFRAVEDASFALEQYGLVVKKGHAELLAQLNAGLRQLREDGGYAEIHTRWFGTAPAGAASGASR